MQIQLIQLNKHLLNPCDASGALTDAEEDNQEKHENDPVLKEVMIRVKEKQAVLRPGCQR